MDLSSLINSEIVFWSWTDVLTIELLAYDSYECLINTINYIIGINQNWERESFFGITNIFS